jgi:hypothetical protein
MASVFTAQIDAESQFGSFIQTGQKNKRVQSNQIRGSAKMISPVSIEKYSFNFC